MVRIILLMVISICFTALKIYADCDLPTGGACSIEVLKQRHEESENLKQKNYTQEFDKKYLNGDESEIKKDLQEQVDFDLLKNLHLKIY